MAIGSVRGIVMCIHERRRVKLRIVTIKQASLGFMMEGSFADQDVVLRCNVSLQRMSCTHEEVEVVVSLQVS